MRQEFYDARALKIMECAERGMSKGRTAAKLSLTPATIRKYIKLYGIQFNPNPAGFGREELQRAADEGLSRQEASMRFGVSYSTMHKVSRDLGIEFVRPGKGADDIERADAMGAMYRAGKTLQNIGDVYGVSRERVRQIIKRHLGFTAEDGGAHFQAKIIQAQKNAKREADCWEKNGCSLKQVEALRKAGRDAIKAGLPPCKAPTRAFSTQRGTALQRGIEWKLRLWDWWTIWQQSGKWDERGRQSDAYVMCRFRDEGPYAVGNVYIATLRHNSSVQPNNPNRLSHPDHANVIELRRTA